MTDQDSSYYRPRSPDFSSFQPAFSPSFSPGNPLHTGPISPYPLPSPLEHRASYDASPFFSAQYQRSSAVPSQQYVPQFAPIDPSDDMARRSARLSARSAAEPAAVAPVPGPASTSITDMKYTSPAPPSFAPPAAANTIQTTTVVPSQEPEKFPAPNIEVKTKFPVARIKRIMQADEDVGKVAQVTPIAVSKALELFMISLVTKAAKEAKDRSSKRVTAVHLKQAVVKDEVLDFLADIIAKVPDHPASARKHEDDGSDHNEGRRKRGGRRPKEESD